MRQTATAEVCLDEGKATSSSTARRATRRFGFEQRQLRSNFVAARLDETENHAQQPGNLGNVGGEPFEHEGQRLTAEKIGDLLRYAIAPMLILQAAARHAAVSF